MLNLEVPHESHREMYEDMIWEWSQEDDFNNTSPWALFLGRDFWEFLQIIKQISLWKDVEKTQSTLFFLIKDNKIIWWIDMRHNIDSQYLRDFGGHIGYGIRPSERKKWYATQILKLWLIEAKNIWINKILISCHPDNFASEKVIVKNAWIYDKTAEDWKGIYKRYWITL